MYSAEWNLHASVCVICVSSRISDVSFVSFLLRFGNNTPVVYSLLYNIHCLFTPTWKCNSQAGMAAHKTKSHNTYTNKPKRQTIFWRHLDKSAYVGANSVLLYQHFLYVYINRLLLNYAESEINVFGRCSYVTTKPGSCQTPRRTRGFWSEPAPLVPPYAGFSKMTSQNTRQREDKEKELLDIHQYTHTRDKTQT